MNDTLHDSAYRLAKENYKAALFATSAHLEKVFPAVSMDEALRAAQRGMQLYLAAHHFAEKVWSKELSYELAESSLRKQFHEFSKDICQKSFSDAYTETR